MTNIYIKHTEINYKGKRLELETNTVHSPHIFSCSV
jgi:hypothetical protein